MMCMVQPNGEIEGQLKGKAAHLPLQIYIQWQLGSLNGVYANKEEADDLQAIVEEGVAKLRELMKRKGKLEVFIA